MCEQHTDYDSLSKTRLKDITALRQKKHRDSRGEFLAEGPLLVTEALSHGRVRAIIIRTEPQLPQEYRELLDKALQDDIEVLAATPEQFSKICEARTPQGIAAVTGKVENQMAVMLADKQPVFLLEDLQDPGNVGAVLRSAAAFQAGGIICSKGCADLFNAKTARATQGGIFKVPLAWDCHAEDVIAKLREHGYNILATCPPCPTSVDFTTIEICPGTVIILGNERRGVSERFMEMADSRIHIPTSRQSNSINVAASAAILMHHCYRIFQPGE
ncbi:TrmH family RNA methyltransferase [Planctomycetota bacterium]